MDFSRANPVILYTDYRKEYNPTINKGKNQHYVKGDSFDLECLVVDLKEDLTWTYPNQHVVSISNTLI